MLFEKCMIYDMMKWSAAVIALSGGVAAGATSDESHVIVISPDATGNVTVTNVVSGTMTNEAGDSVQIKIDGIDAQVFVNGKRIGEFKTNGDWVEQSFGDGDAEVVVRKHPGGVLMIEQDGSTMKIGTGGIGLWPNWVGAGELALMLAPSNEAFTQGFNSARSFFVEEQPKVMLGVTMTAPSASQAREFEIDPSKATVLGTVMEGLPAAKAGLKASDIVVGVDGMDDASQKVLREKLATLEAGQTITLKIIRDGGVLEKQVELEAYDPERLGVTQQIWIGSEAWSETDAELEALRARQEEARRALEQAMQRSLNADGQRARDRAAAEAATLNERLEELTTQIAKRMSRRATQQFFQNQAQGEMLAQIAPQVLNDIEGNMFLIPSAPAMPAWNADAVRQSEEMIRQRDARIQELESRLDAMSKKMERLEALLLELKTGSSDE